MASSRDAETSVTWAAAPVACCACAHARQNAHSSALALASTHTQTRASSAGKAPPGCPAPAGSGTPSCLHLATSGILDQESAEKARRGSRAPPHRPLAVAFGRSRHYAQRLCHAALDRHGPSSARHPQERQSAYSGKLSQIYRGEDHASSPSAAVRGLVPRDHDVHELPHLRRVHVQHLGPHDDAAAAHIIMTHPAHGWSRARGDGAAHRAQCGCHSHMGMLVQDAHTHTHSCTMARSSRPSALRSTIARPADTSCTAQQRARTALDTSGRVWPRGEPQSQSARPPWPSPAPLAHWPARA